jgi:hypothetical protein
VNECTDSFRLMRMALVRKFEHLRLRGDPRRTLSPRGQAFHSPAGSRAGGAEEDQGFAELA